MSIELQEQTAVGIAIAASDMSLSYGGRPVFENANFFVPFGEKVALVGPNGAGKTTIIRMILGVETPDSGEVIVAKRVQNSAGTSMVTHVSRFIYCIIRFFIKMDTTTVYATTQL